MSTDATTLTKEFRNAVENAVRELVSVDHRKDGSFVVVPNLYPSGASALVSIARSGKGFYVNDYGFAYHEAEQQGGTNILMRHAKAVAERYGILFEGQSFFAEVTEADRLPGVISAVSSASGVSGILCAGNPWVTLRRGPHDAYQARTS